MIAIEIEENLSDINAELMYQWFIDNEDRIYWNEFLSWKDDVEGTYGYDWVDELFEMWQVDEL